MFIAKSAARRQIISSPAAQPQLFAEDILARRGTLKTRAGHAATHQNQRQHRTTRWL